MITDRRLVPGAWEDDLYHLADFEEQGSGSKIRVKWCGGS